MSLDGKVAIVTGAAQGLGQAYAVGLAEAGVAVVAVDRDDCAATVELIAGDQALGLTVDVIDLAAVNAMAEQAKAAFGRIDILINNAALYATLTGGRFDQLAEAEWDACMSVNVKGSWNCCKAAVPHMREVGGGAIINISSLAATYGMPFALHYTTSKAAVIGLTRGLARELGRDNIRVNAVAPSAVTTPGTKQFFGDRYERGLQVIAAGQSIQQNLDAADLVGTILYLADDASRFVTGQTIAVDGGTVFL